MAREKTPKVTRRDVAHLAGVSTAVVSYVVNNGPRPVAPATRQRVLDAIEQLGYFPSASARALKLGATGTYGLMVPNVTNPFHAEIIEHIDLEMGEHGWSMLLGHSHHDVLRERQILAEMVGHGVDGMIVMMSAMEDSEWIRQALPVPAVFLDRQRPLYGHVTIGPDFKDAGRQATEHLISHGRRRIVPVHGPRIPTMEILRLTGYEHAIREAGLKRMEPVETWWSMEGGYRAGLEVMERDSVPDGIFCFSDAIGLGMLRALKEKGVRVPDDIAVVCFDGTPATEFTSPPLTSVTQPVATMARIAVAALGEPAPAGFDHREFPVNLVQRQSCGC